MSSQGFEARLKLASNRLPVSVSPKENGEYELKPSSGGLVSSLRGLGSAAPGYTWYGWPGTEIPEQSRDKLSQQLREEHSAVPVYLDAQLAERYYDGFSSELLL